MIHHATNGSNYSLHGETVRKKRDAHWNCCVMENRSSSSIQRVGSNNSSCGNPMKKEVSKVVAASSIRIFFPLVYLCIDIHIYSLLRMYVATYLSRPECDCGVSGGLGYQAHPSTA